MKLRAWMLFVLLTLAGLGMVGVGLRASRQASVIVEWSTASELDTVGFNILRSDSQDGDSMKLNDSLIETRGDALTGSDYTFVDKSALPGRTYYYWLEDVSAGGSAHRNGPIQVRAEPGGRLELGIGAILLIVALLGAIWTRRPLPRRHDNAG